MFFCAPWIIVFLTFLIARFLYSLPAPLQWPHNTGATHCCASAVQALAGTSVGMRELLRWPPENQAASLIFSQLSAINLSDAAGQTHPIIRSWWDGSSKGFRQLFCANHSVLTKLAGRGSSSDTRMQVQYTFETIPTPLCWFFSPTLLGLCRKTRIFLWKRLSIALKNRSSDRQLLLCRSSGNVAHMLPIYDDFSYLCVHFVLSFKCTFVAYSLGNWMPRLPLSFHYLWLTVDFYLDDRHCKKIPNLWLYLCRLLDFLQFVTFQSATSRFRRGIKMCKNKRASVHRPCACFTLLHVIIDETRACKCDRPYA